MMHNILIFGLFISLLNVQNPLQDMDTFPIEYIGEWTGFADQYNGGAWPMEMTITGGKVGEQIGTINYPSLGCGGELILMEIRINELVLREKITSGWRCVNNGIIYLGLDGEGLSFYWDHESLKDFRAKGSFGPKNVKIN
jgi:hypothetical protein